MSKQWICESCGKQFENEMLNNEYYDQILCTKCRMKIDGKCDGCRHWIHGSCWLPFCEGVNPPELIGEADQ